MCVVVIARRHRDAGARGKREVGLGAGLDLVAEGVSRTPDCRQHPDQREERCPKRLTTIPNGSSTRTANGRAGSTCVARPDLRGLCELHVSRLQLEYAFTTSTTHRQPGAAAESVSAGAVWCNPCRVPRAFRQCANALVSIRCNGQPCAKHTNTDPQLQDAIRAICELPESHRNLYRHRVDSEKGCVRLLRRRRREVSD